MAARTATGAKWRFGAVGVLGVLALAVVTAVVAFNTTQIGCERVDSPSQALPSALVVGFAVALGLSVSALLAARFGRRSRRHPELATFVLGIILGAAASIFALVVWAIQFPALLCAPTG